MKRKSIDKKMYLWRSGCKREQVIEDRFSYRVANIYKLHTCWKKNCNDNGGQYKLNNVLCM